MDLTTLTDKELLDLKEKTEYSFTKYKILQMTKKVQLNSAYGALGNEYFRFYDVRLASATTLSGQLAIRWVEKDLNDFLNKLLATDEDYVIAIDTDSVYISLEKVIDAVYVKKNKKFTVDQAVEFINKFCEQHIQKIIDKSYIALADYTQAYKNKMVMKRESIANTGIWTGKKHYMLNVYYDEDVRYTTPEIKMMGVEAVKSSIPVICRKKMKELIKLILNSTEDVVQKEIAKFKEEFNALPAEIIAQPRGVSEVEKYKNAFGSCVKATPINSRAAITYNKALDDNKLTKKYNQIRSGDKIKYIFLKEPNPYKSNVIGFHTKLPHELDIKKYIDYNLQFEKTFLQPIKIILSAIGWDDQKRATLNDLWE